jgi:hypothetical protein
MVDVVMPIVTGPELSESLRVEFGIRILYSCSDEMTRARYGRNARGFSARVVHINQAGQ